MDSVLLRAADVLRQLRQDSAHCFDDEDDYTVILSRFVEEFYDDEFDRNAFLKRAQGSD